MNQALEQRAHLHLLRLLSRERSHNWHRYRAGLTEADPDTERPLRLSRYESVVDAYHALQAISAAEARSWRRRFESASIEAEVDMPEPDSETRGRVEPFLNELVSEQRAAGGAAQERATRFGRPVRALEGVGAIPPEEAQRWIDRIDVELGLPTRKEEDERDRARTCTALDLRRVIAAPMVVGDLRISHLELYADGALLYSLETGPEGSGRATCGTDPRSSAPFSQPRKESPLTVGDDLGTVYEPRPYHGFAKALTPPVPEAASRLDISYRDAVGKIPLR